jgi:hypothetical protein
VREVIGNEAGESQRIVGDDAQDFAGLGAARGFANWVCNPRRKQKELFPARAGLETAIRRTSTAPNPYYSCLASKRNP